MLEGLTSVQGELTINRLGSYSCSCPEGYSRVNGVSEGR